VLCSDHLARLAVDLTNTVLEARVAARSRVVAIADFEPRPVRDRNRARVGAARESTRERIADRRGKEVPRRDAHRLVAVWRRGKARRETFDEPLVDLISLGDAVMRTGM